MGMVARFCRSADPEITTRHVPAVEGLGRPEHEVLGRHLLPYATRAWADLAGGPRGRLKPTHDVYLKQWQLAGPRLTAWDVILYDEAQDADPCIAAVVEHQDHAQLIAVGDSAQAIYSWRGAGDFLSRLDAAYRLRLTQSWRFGQAIADEANVWLGALGTDMRISGNPARDSQVAPLEHPDTILCRTNAGTIDALLDAHDQGVKVHLVGGGTEMLALAQAAERLQAGRAAGHPELALFSTWDQVVDYAVHDPSGSDLAVAVRMIDRYGADGVIAAISGSVPGSQADRVVSTAHKAKGLEWATVRIGDDFREPLDPKTGEPLPIPPADAMLAYVSVTRAMDTLDTDGLGWVHDHLAALEASSGETVEPETTPISAVVLPASEDTIVATGRDGDAGRPRASTPGLLGDAALREQPADRIADPRDETLAAAGEHEACFYAEQAAGTIAAMAEGSDASPLPRIEVGSRVLVADEHGEWLVRSVAKDGSFTCYQAGANGRARSFRPEWCTPASRTGKGGKPVKVRNVTQAARRARAAWREQAGFPLPPPQWQPDPPGRG